jgi:uncharacterized protein YegP (UPF0339 family)
MQKDAEGCAIDIRHACAGDEEMQFVIDEGNDNQFHWRLIGDNGSELAVSATGFASVKAARRAAMDVRAHAGSATGAEG